MALAIIDEYTGKGTPSTRYYYRNKELVNQKRYAHKYNNQAFWLYKAAKARAVRKGLDFDISVEDITVPEFCPVFGVKLLASEQRAGDFSPSLDRMDNTKGYVKGNIVVISNKANRLKGDASVQDLERLVDWLKKKFI
jgi:hypothetical protein